jgi:hypothetical protein
MGENEPDWRALLLSLQLTVLQEALRRSVLKMCKTQDPATVSKWLSKLEDDLVRSIKETVMQGASMTDEVRMMDGAIKHIRFVLDKIRRQITNKSEGK